MRSEHVVVEVDLTRAHAADVERETGRYMSAAVSTSSAMITGTRHATSNVSEVRRRAGTAESFGERVA